MANTSNIAPTRLLMLYEVSNKISSQLYIKISDNGAGIPAENLEKIYDPGFTTKGVKVGIGLGLSIGYKIMEDHGGSIQVESKVGKGTTVTIRLPVQ